MGLTIFPRRDVGERPTIVLVDDDPLVCDLVSETLEAAGYLVLAVDDGAEAMDVIWNSQPALVILDCGLPGRPGMALLGDLRASAMFSDLPIVMLTGRSSKWHEKSALKCGASCYVRKPFDPRELLVAVAKALRECALTAGISQT